MHPKVCFGEIKEKSFFFRYCLPILDTLGKSLLKLTFCLSQLIKRAWLMFSLRQYCLDFNTSNVHLSTTFIANYFLVNQKQKGKIFKTYDIVHPSKCKSSIVSIVMPSHPNLYLSLFLWYVISLTTAHTLNMKISYNIP